MEAPFIYESSTGGALRQAEIIASLKQHTIDVKALEEDRVPVVPVMHRFAIVLSQDCDLEQDYVWRNDAHKGRELTSVLFCPALPEDEVRGSTSMGSREWRAVKENRNQRYQFLCAAPPKADAKREGTPNLIVDFREYFSMPASETYFSLASAARRLRLQSPYLEHLTTRFAAYAFRVGLPIDHHDVEHAV